VHITGKGAHGAHPHQSIDPVLIACHLGTALQSIVSRNIAPQETAALSVTRIQAGDAYNVIPQTATLAGTVRTMKRDIMSRIEENMTRLATSIAAGFGGEAMVKFRVVTEPTVNNADEMRAYGDAAAAVVGEENVDRNYPATMGTEDFSYMMDRVPGAHLFLGNGASAPVHNQLYDFNDQAIPYGVSIYAAMVERKLPKGTAD
jgi:hippurate hydrolase